MALINEILKTVQTQRIISKFKYRQ